MLLLAAASETALIDELVAGLPPVGAGETASRTQLITTLLFLAAVGLKRPWDLRSYGGDGLALLTGRRRAYGYVHTERFLADVAQADGDQTLTTAVARWSARLWAVDAQRVYYVDMHRKPVYTAQRIPRGLIGRTGQVLGCRALVLLNDEAGHPLVALTGRGDTHLTRAFPQLLAHYHQALGEQPIQTVVLDREGMGSAFLHSLAGVCTVTTLLRRNQYQGEASFSDVGPFTPLTVDEDGTIIREVAPARFALPGADEVETPLRLAVALIRDWSQPTAAAEQPATAAEPRKWDSSQWWEEGYVATPLPATATAPKLIALVSTAEEVSAVDLVATYKRRWPAQENIIRDFLLPLGWDSNHGYARTAVENSEVAKRRQAWQTQLDNVRRWRAQALLKSSRADRLYQRRWQQTKDHGEALYRQLNEEQLTLLLADVPSFQVKQQIRDRKAVIDAELSQMQEKMYRALHNSRHEWHKARRYAQKERHLLRQLEDLDRQEKQMYELDNRKDQVMVILRLALANLIMWTRDHFFPAHYAQATWRRLAPFFRLPGHVVDYPDRCLVYLRPFNDRQLTRDLDALCRRVNDASPRLPDGRHLHFVCHRFATPIPDMPP